MAQPILVLGWFGHGNTGDEAYKIAFPKVFPQYDFQFVDHIEQDHKAEAYVLGGGNVLTSEFINQLSKINGKQKSIISCSAFNDIKPDDLKLFDKIIVRDKLSLNKLQKLGLDCSLMPDLGFSFEVNYSDGYIFLKNKFIESRCELYDKVITVVVNAYVAISGADARKSKDELAFLHFCYSLAEIIDQVPASFVFIPFSTRFPADDRISNALVASRCKFWKKNIVVFDKLSVQDTINIIGASDAVISMRLHSTIFSCVANVPFVDITHHDKNLGFLDTIGKIDSSISYWNFDTDKCKRMINDMLKEPEPIRAELKGITTEQKRQLVEVSNNVRLC